RHKLLSGCGCCGAGSNFSAAPVSRRDFIAGGGAALGLATSIRPSRAQQPSPKRRIDVHHHIVPPVHAEAMAKHKSSGGTKWSVSQSLADMDKAGVTTSITSILNPGVWFGQIDEESRKLARACNEYAKKLEGDYPGRFRTF